MAKLFLLLVFLACLQYGRSYPFLNEEIDDNFDSDDEMLGEMESVEDDETDALMDYKPSENHGTKAYVEDESDLHDDDSYAMKLKKKAIDKAVEKILKRVDKINKKSKKKPSTHEIADQKLSKKDEKIKEEIKEATKKKMIKKNEETYQGMMKVGKKIDNIAKKIGVKIPKVKPQQY